MKCTHALGAWLSLRLAATQYGVVSTVLFGAVVLEVNFFVASMTEVASTTSKTHESGRTRNGSDRTTMGPSAGRPAIAT